MTTTEQSERIRAYLTGDMAPEQHEEFELALIDDPNFAETVNAERLLLIGVREYFARRSPESSGQGD